MHITLDPHLGCNIMVYIDKIIIKSQKQESLLGDLEEAFDSLWAKRVKLNPERCIFGVPSGKLLSFLVSHRGIEVNPNKIWAIEQMRVPTHVKVIQRLVGCMAGLGRFIAKLGERALPLFKLLKKTYSFQWITDVDAALRIIKRHLFIPPVLIAP
jgi:hypothetical protein